MTKERIKSEIILPRLSTDGEELIGFFQATYIPRIWWVLLFGPFMLLGMRIYYVGVTNKGMQLHKLSIWGTPDTYNFLPYTEISNMKLGTGFLQAPLQFVFSNGKKLTLRAQLKGVDTLAKLDDKTKEFLISKST